MTLRKGPGGELLIVIEMCRLKEIENNFEAGVLYISSLIPSPGNAVLAGEECCTPLPSRGVCEELG